MILSGLLLFIKHLQSIRPETLFFVQNLSNDGIVIVGRAWRFILAHAYAAGDRRGEWYG